MSARDGMRCERCQKVTARHHLLATRVGLLCGKCADRLPKNLRRAPGQKG